VVDGQIVVEESSEAPNLPPGLTVDGHVLAPPGSTPFQAKR
jgi:3-phenylpropionate/trans-cinnamate dioxygenase ferredoxin subunit